MCFLRSNHITIRPKPKITVRLVNKKNDQCFRSWEDLSVRPVSWSIANTVASRLGRLELALEARSVGWSIGNPAYRWVLPGAF